jgi:hypothetical protein
MKRVFIAILCCLALSAVSLSEAVSGEVKFPTPSYGGQELEKVRQWEKTWAGKKITTENVDQVKDFLHEGIYKAMKEPENFGAKSLWFTVVPYRPYNLSKGMIEATQKYAPESKLIDEDSLAGYGEVAGIPFPQPKTGTEMAWNFDGNTKGDSHEEDAYGFVANCRTGQERTAGMVRWELYWAGRVDMEPKPKIPDKQNPRGIAKSFFHRHTAPADFVDTSFLELKWQDPKREEAVWVYTVMFRRIRRYSTSQRTDSVDGTDMVYDDMDGWYTHVTRNTYAYKGRADLLVARHQDAGKLERVKGQAFWNGVQRERANHWIVEVKSKQKGYLYSKQIWYLDPETWQMNFKAIYNRKGEFWKMQELFYDEHPTAIGEKASTFTSDQIFDLIRHHGTTQVRKMSNVGKPIRLDLFQTKSLKQKSY